MTTASTATQRLAALAPAGTPAAGDDDLVLRHHELSRTRLMMIDGRLTTHLHSREAGLSARLRRGGYWGFAASDAAQGDAAAVVDQARRNALAMARFGSQAEAVMPGAVHRGLHPVAARPAPSAAEAIDALTALNAWCRQRYPGLDSVRLMLADEAHDKHIITGRGGQALAQIRRALLYVWFTTQADDGSPLELWEPMSFKGSIGDVTLQPEQLAPVLDELHRHLQAKRSAVPVRGGEHTVVMASALAGILAHEAMGHPCEADIVQGGAITGGLLGQPVASPLITMVDIAHTWRGQEVMMPVHVDDEGTPAEDVVLIDRGRLNGFMHSRETAQALGVAVGQAPTGNARAYSPTDEPLVRMRNTAILPGESRFDQMVAGVDDGYLLLKTGNGQADSTTEFMFGVTLGYEVKGGRVGRAIRHTTVSGSAIKVLGSVDAVSDEMSWEASGYCGKKQPMVVAMGGPAIRARAQLGGE